MQDLQPPGRAPLPPSASSSRRQCRFLLAFMPLVTAPLLGVGLAWGQDQLSPAPSPAAAGDTPQPAISMPLVPPPVPLAQPLRPDPTALPSRPRPRFEASLDALVRDGLVSPEERARIRSGSGMSPVNEPAHQRACSSGALSQQECSSGLVVRWQGKTIDASEPTTKPLSTNELALLQRIRADSSSSQWRVYGQCKYDWAGWKLHSNGTRTTAADCGGTAMRWTVGVSCHHLLIATKATASGWSKWARPNGPENKSRQGEDEMVAALCANAP